MEGKKQESEGRLVGRQVTRSHNSCTTTRAFLL